jgi:hypothetical protein
LKPQEHAEQQREVGREVKAVAMHDLHAGVHHPGEVEICHAAAEVTAQPRPELTVQPVGVEVGGRVGDIDDDVSNLVDISRADGHQQGFELVLSWAA